MVSGVTLKAAASSSVIDKVGISVSGISTTVVAVVAVVATAVVSAVVSSAETAVKESENKVDIASSPAIVRFQ